MQTLLQRAPVNAAPGGAWGPISIRTNIRDNFPRPSEAKRIRVHGWKTRMSKPSGRAIIWKRIIKGKYVLSH